ncbi:HAD-like protein [Fomitiporia mediterranea MF3/22]|uniref:HAD-like protein n=1 Tax=Fomitiporia mediterranea (strain MF3/22) TaxID=694068 RepID=UPI00044083FA|nr:HAD-like protein [Fomitiporia mediterranea MF3/22]EJD03446.1 HAD-like protein [Fomitiporia mediterranea MF3/22]
MASRIPRYRSVQSFETGYVTPPASTSSGASTPSSAVFDLPLAPLSPLSPTLEFGDSEPSTSPCENIIFDLGDVLFTWTAETKTRVNPKMLKKILRSATWFEFEKGNLTEQEAYDTVAAELRVESSDVREAFQAARDSLKSNPQLVSLIRQLKEQHGIRVFAMSNISAPDFAVLRGKVAPEELKLFERVFTSHEARERKPNLGFYKYVLEQTGVDPVRTLFIDDKLENILPARSLGMKGIVFDNFENMARQLRNYVGDPIGRAQAWLKDNAKKMLSVTNTGVTVHENFAPLLIYEATGDRSLVEYVEHPRLFNFFIGEPVMTTEEFPFDLDTTSIGLTVSTHVDYETKMSVMDEMLTYVNKDGIIQTYFDPSRPRTDPIVCVNVLTFFYMHGRGSELESTLDWVYSILQHRAYMDGTLYYYTADCFLFFLSRLLSVAPPVYSRFAPLFARRVFERSGADGDALGLAMRIIAGAAVGVRMYVDHERLLKLQEEDGSFPLGWAYKYGGSGILLGNKGWTTALAVQAIQAFNALDRELF